MKVTLTGEKELLQKLKKLEDSVRGQVLSDALQAAAKIIQESASQKAPRRTGTLASNIEVGKVNLTASGGEIPVGPNKKAFYGMFVEVGTSKMRAQPYLRPAIDESKGAATSEFTKVLKAAIEGAAK